MDRLLSIVLPVVGIVATAFLAWRLGRSTRGEDAARALREADERARTENERLGAQLRAETESARKDAEAARADAGKIRLELEAEARKALAASESAKQRAQIEIDAARQKAVLDAKEIALRAREDAERALDQERQELVRIEKRVSTREESLEKKVALADQREGDLLRREQKTRQGEQEQAERERRLAEETAKVRARLEEIAGLTSEEAKKQVVAGIVEEARRDAAREVLRLEEEATEEAKSRAARVVGIALQRYAGDYACERTVTVVALPTDEMKGRIIGREGRNIRALEAATGIDIIIDDTPEAIVLSGYNPVRREVARRAIEALLKDGRIHPARIEEVVVKSTADVDASIKEHGERAVFDLGIAGLHPELVKLMGSLRYRTSHTQNQWQHSLEVGFLAGAMAAELGANVKEARRAGFLHDLGKAVSHEVEGGHAVIGADLARKYGENARIVHAIRAHHDDEKPQTVLAHLVAAADAISGARPGARSENLDAYIKRIEDMEHIATSFPGVDRCFAIQAGREMRVLVDNGKVSDETAVLLSRDIARKIEQELTYPGQIRVVVIRETRAVELAK